MYLFVIGKCIAYYLIFVLIENYKCVCIIYTHIIIFTVDKKIM